MKRLFANDTDREGWRDWARYYLCRAIGHQPRHEDGHSEWWCARCGDVLPEGNKRFQK